MNKNIAILAVGSLTTGFLISFTMSTASARPAYHKVYTAEHGRSPQKCHVCHDVKNRKVLNEYGKYLNRELDGKTNVKDVEIIRKALLKADEKYAEDHHNDDDEG